MLIKLALNSVAVASNGSFRTPDGHLKENGKSIKLHLIRLLIISIKIDANHLFPHELPFVAFSLMFELFCGDFKEMLKEINGGVTWGYVRRCLI